MEGNRNNGCGWGEVKIHRTVKILQSQQMPYNVTCLRQMGNPGLTTAYMFLYGKRKKHRTKALHLATAGIKNVSGFECWRHISSQSI